MSVPDAVAAETAAPAVSARPLDNGLLLASGLAWLGGLIHVQAALDHFDEYAPYAVLFIVLAIAQGVWGLALCRWQGRRLALAGAVGSLAVVGVWLCSRVVGLPFGPDATGPEPIGFLDAIATLDELAIVGLVLVRLGLFGPSRAGARGRVVSGLAIVMLVFSSLALAHGYHAH